MVTPHRGVVKSALGPPFPSTVAHHHIKAPAYPLTLNYTHLCSYSLIKSKCIGIAESVHTHSTLGQGYPESEPS